MNNQKTISEQLENIYAMSGEIWIACQQTFIMVGISVFIGVILGLILGIILYITSPKALYERPWIHRLNGLIVDFFRAFPFVILMIALGPFTKSIAGTTIGPIAASVTLSVAAIFYFARLVEQNLREIDKGIIEAALAMGANPIVIIAKVLIKESLSGLVSSMTILTITILSASAAAGMIGGGGLGDLAIRYGHYRYQTEIMITIIIILSFFVIVIQSIGNYLTKYLNKR